MLIHATINCFDKFHPKYFQCISTPESNINLDTHLRKIYNPKTQLCTVKKPITTIHVPVTYIPFLTEKYLKIWKNATLKYKPNINISFIYSPSKQWYNQDLSFNERD